MKIRICQAITSLEVGGAERVVTELAARLDRTRFDVTVMAVCGGGPLAVELKARGVPVRAFGLRQGSRTEGIAEIGRMIGFLRGRFDLVHSHPGTVARYAAIAARTGALVSTLHSTYAWKSSLWRASDRFLMGRTDRIVAVSEAVRESAARVYRFPVENIGTVYNGVDIDCFRPAAPAARANAREALGLDPDQFWFAAVGHLIPDKRYDLLIRAIARRRAQGGRAALALAGDGPERKALEALAGETGLRGEGAVVFLGRREDVPQVLAACNAFAHAAAREGLPLSVIEAMSTALPIVATRVGGLPELVLHGTTGLLVAPGDEGGLMAQLGRVESEPGLARDLGAAAARRARELFSVDAMVRTYERLYDEVMEGRLRGEPAPPCVPKHRD